MSLKFLSPILRVDPFSSIALAQPLLLFCPPSSLSLTRSPFTSSDYSLFSEKGDGEVTAVAVVVICIGNSGRRVGWLRW